MPNRKELEIQTRRSKTRKPWFSFILIIAIVTRIVNIGHTENGTGNKVKEKEKRKVTERSLTLKKTLTILTRKKGLGKNMSQPEEPENLFS